MIILGLLLILGIAGLSFAVWQMNETVLNAPVGTIELLGRHADLTAGQMFLTGAGAGALVVLSFVMLFGGMGRNARRRRVPDYAPTTTREAEKEPAIR
jgi:cytochrome c biogenesis factor